MNITISVRPAVWRMTLLTLFVLGIGGLSYCAVDCFAACVAAVRYTIPASAMSASFSLIDYLRETGLGAHLASMPASAQQYFLRQGLGGYTFGALAAVTAIAAVRYKERQSAGEPQTPQA